MKWIKLSAVNLLVTFALLLFSEIIARSMWTVNSCIKSDCDLSRIRNLKVRNLAHFQPGFIGSSRFDAQLGYVPMEGFARTINDYEERWTNVKVTIRIDGFRSNHSGAPARDATVLVVGDSFTFGDQVSDDETWPACLESTLNQGVDNGGVYGYGAAQALRRALLRLQQKTYTHLVFSILVGSGFERDRLMFFSGHPRPAVIRTTNGIQWAPVPDPRLPGSEFHDATLKVLLSLVYERSQLLSNFGAGPSWNWLKTEHPNAANKNEIIKWTLQQFSNVDIDGKMLLLQYPENRDEKLLAERAEILRVANELSLTVVDTLDVIQRYDAKKIWNGHHTAFGNRVVCEYLFQRGFEHLH